ncbi:hypothetical protein H2200_003911 [Cladophialophora chaetospira]|uniref:Uncharacterized protein n=1 Tax=Cladophialophora chaetospira TaxID=386627 RepID=A0AA38XF64_9EURO|nr:hypothetical protein H2200_003911 [Cladophialophora chaetospira]
MERFQRPVESNGDATDFAGDAGATTTHTNAPGSPTDAHDELAPLFPPSLFHPEFDIAFAQPNERSEEDETVCDAVGNHTDLTQSYPSILVTPDTRRVSSETLKPISRPNGYPAINYLPLFLRPWMNITCCILYLSTAVALTVLLYERDDSQKYYFESENFYLAIRYGPAVLGTITSVLFRTTTTEFYRIWRFALMADDKKRISPGALAKHSIAARWYPYVIINLSTFLRIESSTFLPMLVFIGRFISGFVVGNKSALLTLERKEKGWVLTYHSVPAVLLIATYCVLFLSTVAIIRGLSSRNTGLMWDPSSLADQVALFKQCDTLRLLEDIDNDDSHHDVTRRKFANTRFRLGYWEKTNNHNEDDKEILYGIGAMRESTLLSTAETSQVHQINPEPIGAAQARSRANSRSANDIRSDAVGTQRICQCQQACVCVQYPYQHMPFVSTPAVVVHGALVFASLAILVVSLCLSHWTNGFSVLNTLGVNGTSYVHSNSTNTSHATGNTTTGNQTLNSDEIFFLNIEGLSLDKHHNLWVYVFLFRALPTVFASFFVNTLVDALDYSHRFVQPFLAMRQHGGGLPDETVLLTYTTASSLEVPTRALNAGHYKVAYFSLLFNMAALFPIYVASLYTIVNTGDRVYFTYSHFSLSSVILYLVIFTITLFLFCRGSHRLMPLNNYNLAEMVAMCRASYFATSPDLDNNIPGATQGYMYDRIRLRLCNLQDRFMFGYCLGTDGKGHVGFDIGVAEGQNTHTVSPLDKIEVTKKVLFGLFRRKKTEHYKGGWHYYDASKCEEIELDVVQPGDREGQ